MSKFLGRLAKGFGYLLGAVVFLLAVALSFALTETGSGTIARYVLDSLNRDSDFRIDAEQIGGSLISGLVISGVEFDHPAVNLKARELRSAWKLGDLASGNWRIEDVAIESLVLTLPEQAQTDAVDEATDAAPLDMVPVEFSHVTINGFSSNIDPLLDTQTLEGTVRLSGSEVILTVLTLESELGQVSGDLTIDIATELGLESRLLWQLADAAFPPLSGYSGELRVDGSLVSLAVDSTLLSPYRIQSRGVVSNLADVAELQLDLQHEAAALDLSDFVDGQQLVLSNLQLATRGDPQRLQVTATGSAQVQTLPSHDFDIAGVLGGDNLQLDNYHLQRGDASVSGSLSIDWQDLLSIAGNYRLSEFNVAEYLSAEQRVELLPTAISSTGRFDLSSDDAGLRINADIAQVSGLLGESRINGAGQLSFADQVLEIPQLFLESDELQLSVSGTAGASNALNWSITLDDLGSLLANANGSLVGEGQLLGSMDAPFLNGIVQGQNLRLDAMRLGNLSAQIEGSPQRYEAVLELEQFLYTTESIREELDTVLIQLQGSDETLSVSLVSASPAGAIDLALSGGQLRQNPWGWSGRLERLNLQAAMDWTLASPGRIELSESLIELENSCLLSAATSLCFALQALPSAGAGEYSASLQGFPLAQLEQIPRAFPFATLGQMAFPVLPAGLSFSGDLEASASGSYSAEVDPTLDFSLGSSNPVMSLSRARDVDPADMVTTEAEEHRDYYWRDVALSGGLQDRRWTMSLGGALEQQLVDNNSFPLEGEIDATLSINADGSLSGFSNAHFDDLGWLEVYVVDMSNIRGELDSEFAISGTLELPRVNGYVSVANSSFLLDTWGVEIQNFEGELTATENGRAAIEASVSTEEGYLTLTGNAQNMLAGTGEITLRLQGENFSLMDTPELSASITPNLELRSTAESIHIQGSLALPRLMIALAALPETAIDVSSDVVITRAPVDRPDLEYSLAAEQSRFMNRPLTAELDIELGDSVSFSGFGLSTELSGNLSTEVLPNGSNRTFGELTIEDGSYSLYGQTLQLQDGSLLFIGPYDNPGLNVRAIREVNGTQVGVLMNGTLRNIQSELFSTPPLAEADIVALLVTGRPISEMGSSDEAALLGSIARLGLERGRSISERVRGTLGLDTFAITNTGDINNTLLTVGKYLTPSIFVRYGVGLFDSQSKVAVDYELTETLKLQAESGEHQSLDLTYSIER